MASEWPSVRIAEIADKIAMGPFGSNIKVETFVDEGVPVISGAHLRGSRVEDGQFNFVTPEHAERLKNSNVYRGDVIFTHAGNIGQVAYVPNNSRYERYVISQRQFYLRCNPTKAHPAFITYFFHSPEGRHKLLANASQVGVPSISRPSSNLKEIELCLPELHEQEAIVEFLGAIDDRIENLRQTNATLEAIAQTLFKSWFVDFDPVRAKAEGREPDGIDAATAALFPSEFDDSELGPIPKGWRAACLRDVCKTHDSKRVPLSSMQREKRRGIYPYYGAASVMDHIDDFLFDGVYVLLAEDGSVATKSGCAMTQYAWGRIWVNNHAHVLEGTNGYSTEQLLLHLQRVKIEEFVTGAVQAKLSQANMFRIPVVISPQAILEAFAEFVGALFGVIRGNSDRMNALADLRDTLLPRLISGRLRLPEVQAIAAEAAAA